VVRVASLVLASALTATAGDLEAADPETTLIRNVRLIDRAGQTEDRRVNLLIKGAKLHIVTADEIKLEDGLVGYDGQDGVVIGVLDIGQRASFLIVDRDPRAEHRDAPRHQAPRGLRDPRGDRSSQLTPWSRRPQAGAGREEEAALAGLCATAHGAAAHLPGHHKVESSPTCCLLWASCLSHR